MGFENIPRWGWAIMGVVAGLVIAAVHTGLEPSYPRTVGAQEFERDLMQRDVPGDRPRIGSITIHPAVEGAYNKPVQVLTFMRATYVPKEQGWVYYPYAFRAELPFKSPSGDEAPNMSAFLRDMKGQADWVSYKYAWWEEPKWTYTLWTIGCVVVIGGVWPSIIDLLIGAGLAKPRKTKEEKAAEKAYLNRFGKGGREPEKVRASTEMSDAERKRLESMTAAMESDLAEGASARGATAVAEEDHGPVKKLDAGPLQIADIQKEEEKKDYKGEFYPVAKTVHKPHDPDPHHKPPSGGAKK